MQNEIDTLMLTMNAQTYIGTKQQFHRQEQYAELQTLSPNIGNINYKYFPFSFHFQ